jgi:alkylhydroperoxidase family enzyme
MTTAGRTIVIPADTSLTRVVELLKDAGFTSRDIIEAVKAGQFPEMAKLVTE